MTDKCFSEHSNRNTVRNPLLSSAVVGLSLEDLTHNAVLLPAAQNSALIRSQDTPAMLPAPERTTETTDRTDNRQKTDDFDVNEYIARLQGSRYVSAPVNAAVDTNMNETEDNLEEINLNEQVEEQSLTADIAQNFSQLPAVLPHMASAVFSSLSNMMRVKSRDQTPEVVDGYRSVQFESQIDSQPLESKVDNPPPLKEPPVGSTGSTFRMTSKKKAYAQIPGLSNSSAVFMQPAVPQQNPISYFTPNQDIQNIPQQPQISLTDPNLPTYSPHSISEQSSNIPLASENSSRTDNFAPTSIQMFSQEHLSASSPSYGNESTSRYDSDRVIQNLPTSEPLVPTHQAMMLHQQSTAQTNQIPSSFPPQTATEIAALGPPIIPPPTMFSNAPKRDSQPNVQRTILPPSVARRLASQPANKTPASLQNFGANIFVPAPIFDGKGDTHNVAPPDVFKTHNVYDSIVNEGKDQANVASYSIANLVPPPTIPTLDPTKVANVVPNVSTIDSTAKTLVASVKQIQTFNATKLESNPSAYVVPPPAFFTPTSNPNVPSDPFSPSKQDISQSMYNTSSQNFNPITTNLPEPPKAVPEPPKMAAGNQSYRMTKKRPQYYSGPIQGVGAISNNYKPVIASDPIAFITPQEVKQDNQTQLFTPSETTESNLYQPAPMVATPAAPFDLSRPTEPIQSFPSQSTQIEASWDLSRQTTDNYEPPNQESTGFGLIGSLKSKLSSLDINKIQSKVTTFFDPAYNDTVKESQFQEHPSQVQSGTQSNLDLFVVPSQQFAQTSAYGQDYHTTQGQSYNYPHNQNLQQEYNYQNQPQVQAYYQDQSFVQQQSFVTQSVEQMIPPNPFWNTDQSFVLGNQYQGTGSTNQPPENVKIEETESYRNYFNYQQEPVFGNEPQTRGGGIEEVKQNVFEPESIPNEEVFVEETKPTLPPIGVPMVPMFSDQSQKSFHNQPTISQASIMPGNVLHGNVESKQISEVDEKPKLDETSNIAFNLNLGSQPPESFFDMPPVKKGAAFKTDSGHGAVKKTELNTEGLKSPDKIPTAISACGFFVKCLEPDVPNPNFFDNPQGTLERKDSKISQELFTKAIDNVLPDKLTLSSLPGNVIESIATSSVIRDIAKELEAERRGSLTERKDSNVGFVPYKPTEIGSCKETDKDGVPLVENAVHIFTGNQNFIDNGSEMEFVQGNLAQNYHDHESELNICETCREVNQPEEEETDLTQKLIENITSPIQLLNPVEVPLTESNEPIEDMTDITNNVCSEITHITEETIETLQLKSATELLDDEIKENFDKNHKLSPDTTLEQNLGWSNPTELKPIIENDYNFHPNTSTVGFYSSNSLFFDDIPNNASDEIKAEFKTALEDSPTNILTRQMSIPTAPPAEDDDNKLDEAGAVLDVISIEHDASKDFQEFFIIEPETDDDKNNRDDDSFTNRVERFHENVVGNHDNQWFPRYQPESLHDSGNSSDLHYGHHKSSTSPCQNTSGGSSTNRPKPTFKPQYSTLASFVAQKYQTSESEFVRNIPQKEDEAASTSFDTSNLFKLEDIERQFPDIIKDTKMCGDVSQNKEASSSSSDVKDNKEKSISGFGDIKELNVDTKPVETLTDPINFFDSNKTDEQQTESDDGSNRLASYFASPKKTEPTKSFFELSQGQDHLRKDVTKPETTQSFFDLSQSQDHYKKKQEIPLDLMKELTSIDNYVPSKDQVVKHVNYFTIKYDNVRLNKVNNALEPQKTFVRNNYKTKFDLGLGFHQIESRVDMEKQEVKTKKAMEGATDSKDTPGPNQKESPSKQMNVTFHFPIDEEKEEHQTLVMSDGRASNEYTPVKHHWFYRVDCEGRSIWKGFSMVDSNALEDAFNSPSLSEQTLVATDGGRFDVNIMGRLRIPVYWVEKPTNVRRCSWFYKGTTDARYVPYTEDIAERLEEEYRHGVTQGAWHRRLSLPNNEAVILHTPAVMVHVLQTPSVEAWGGTRQSTMRPRVVRRGHDESEIEDAEPSGVDHLLLLCHGVGSACDMRFRAVEEVVDDFRATSLQLIQGHYKQAYDTGEIGRVEVLPVSWHGALHAGERGVDRRLARITLESIPRLRAFTNESILDVLFYTSPAYCQTIIDTVCSEINRIYKLFKERNPEFKGGVSLGGHSLGSVILYDLLCHQKPEKPIHPNSKSEKQSVAPPAPRPAVSYPELAFSPEALYALGSPIAMFECTRGVEFLGEDFALPTCRNFFNIFHPYDPIAYRMEPLINAELKDVSPFLIPHHKGRKRMHLELKETMARVGADIKQKLYESIKATWSSMWRSHPPTTEQMEKVVEEEIQDLENEEKLEEPPQQDLDQKTAAKLGKLNGGRRVDHVLQEAPFEMINEYLFAISSHVGYWESEDTMLLILREIYDSLGVRPDARVPQPSLAVTREEEGLLDSTDKPSTSQT